MIWIDGTELLWFLDDYWKNLTREKKWQPYFHFSFIKSNLLISQNCYYITVNLVMFYLFPFEVLLEISRHWIPFPGAMGRKQACLSFWRKVRFNAANILVTLDYQILISDIDQVIILLIPVKYNFVINICLCDSAVWRKWEAEYFSYTQRTIT